MERKFLFRSVTFHRLSIAFRSVPSENATCKRKEEQQQSEMPHVSNKKPRLVFTDIQRRTLQAIFKETKRPSKEMQVTIAQQLALDVTTVANFFMNARRRGADRWKESDSVSGDTNNDNCELSRCSSMGSLCSPEPDDSLQCLDDVITNSY
uniref:Homeobox domain-containing protein n=1 Tax=Romanomermis culicivorax TaxID=13658 RepID=A0A915HW61_ROMCU